MGAASAYSAVLSGIDSDISQLLSSYPEYFSFNQTKEGTVDIRDFGTTGIVAFARGCPFSVMPTGKLTLSGRRVQVKPDYRDQSLEAIDAAVSKIK